MSERDPAKYVHAIVDLDGIGAVHCWAAFVVLASEKGRAIYMGNVQIDYPGPMNGPKDPDTGIRPVLRRAMTRDDEIPLRAALEDELKELLKP